MVMSERLERIIKIDRRIRAGEYPSAEGLSEEFERSVRTIKDDIRRMKDYMDAPIKYNRDKGGYCYTDPAFVLPSVMLSEGELLSFLLADEISKRYLGTPLEAPLKSALSKIRRYLPDHISWEVEEISSLFTFTGGGTVQVDPELFAAMNKAIRERRRVGITYYSASRDALGDRVVDPYHLHNIRGDWYLIAYCHGRKDVRDFLMSRIREWDILKDKFQINPSFSIESYKGRGFLAERGDVEEVVIKFDSYQARWIRERTFHTSQKVEELPDGGLVLRFSVGGLGEIKRWVMAYGSHAEVIKPEGLREEVREEVRKLSEIYG
jgi:predicted DNA-binding transcriptional regulator YafY